MNAHSIRLFIKLAEDDDLYYMLMGLLDPTAIFSVGSFCGALAMNKRVDSFSLLALLAEMLEYGKHKLLKRRESLKFNELKDRLTAVSQNMTKLLEMFSHRSYQSLKAQHHPVI